MTNPVEDPLDRAIALVADGLPVDWESLRAEIFDAAKLAQFDDLRALIQPESGLDREAADTRPSRHDAKPPDHWGHLEVLEPIGAGTYGVVYRAWDTRLDREVALKLLPVDEHERETLSEARRLARVSHPNVVTVYGTDAFEGRSGIWMELLKGQTIDCILKAQGPYSVAEAVLVARQLCGALEAVHAAGLVHRDVKAQNIMREPGGRLVLMDLGASFDTSQPDIEVDAIAGTPLYMAPELFEGEPASRVSDVYAFGVLLYRLVTGEFPIEGRTVGHVRSAHRGLRFRPIRKLRPGLPDRFVAVVEKCLAPDPRDRFDDMAAIDEALSRAVELLAVTSTHRHRFRQRVAAAVLVGLGAAAAVIAMKFSPGAANHVVYGIGPDVYRLFAGYEELALTTRETDAPAAARAVEAGLAHIRPSLPGNHPIYGLLYARLAETSRVSGDLRQADANALDGMVNVLGTVGEDHPFTAVLALELARTAQAAGDHRKVGAELSRALAIRGRILVPGKEGARPLGLLDAAALEKYSRNASCAIDSDRDGLLDLIEVAAGLNPQAADSDRDGTSDDDEDHDGDGVSNRLALGLVGGPFMTWAHYGARDPRTLGWQTPARFPMIEAPSASPPAWSMSTSHTQGYFTQRFSPAHSGRALDRGFSLFARVSPIAGFSGVTIDTSPIGMRFDLLVRRANEHAIEVLAASSVVPPIGPSVVVPLSSSGDSPLLELRYRPRGKFAEAYVSGRPLGLISHGHRQFQETREGGIAWAITAVGATGTNAASRFSLLWLEVF